MPEKKDAYFVQAEELGHIQRADSETKFQGQDIQCG